MKSLTVKIITGLLSVFILTTIGNQIYYRLHDRHDTEEAVLVTINEDIPFKGVIIRDETVITYDGEGVLDYAYPDGSKISVGNTVAEVYPSDDAIVTNNKIAALDEQIEALKTSQDPGLTQSVQPETIKQNLDKEYKTLLANIVSQDYEAVSRSKKSMSQALNIYGIATGSEDNYDGTLKRLTDRRNALAQNASKATGRITASTTGYFVSYADGYEDKLSKKDIAYLTEKDVKNAIKKKREPAKNAIGKMFTDYSCYIAGVIEADRRRSFADGHEFLKEYL